MIIPMRCFTCGELLAGTVNSKYKKFLENASEEELQDKRKFFDSIGLTKYCCRSILVSHINVIDENQFPQDK